MNQFCSPVQAACPLQPGLFERPLISDSFASHRVPAMVMTATAVSQVTLCGGRTVAASDSTVEGANPCQPSTGAGRCVSTVRRSSWLPGWFLACSFHRFKWSSVLPALVAVVVLSVPGGRTALAQFDELTAAPLPPPLPTKAADVEADTELGAMLPSGEEASLQQSVVELEQAIDGLRKRNPEAAEKIYRDLRNALNQYARRAKAEVDTEPKPNRSRFARPEPRFSAAEKVIKRLREAGDVVTVDRLQKQLTRMQEALDTGVFEFPASPEPEIHQVTLRRGSTLPAGLRASHDRFRMGYAEVHLECSTRPVILCLSAREPVVWKVTTDPGVVVQTVIVDSQQDQRVIGLDGVLVIETRTAQAKGLVRRLNGANWNGNGDLLHRLAGGSPVTHFEDDTWSGEKIIIGPKNRDWLVASLVPRVETLIREADATLRSRQASLLQDLKFTATFRNHADGVPETCYGKFTINGPLAETLVPLPNRMLRHLIEVTDNGKPVDFGLTTDARLVTIQSRAAGTQLTPVPLSNQLFAGATRFQAITYDSKRHRLVLAAPSAKGPALVAFDIAEGSWSLVAKLNHPAVALHYVKATDQFWTVLANWSLSEQKEVAHFAQLEAASGNVLRKNRISPSLCDPSSADPACRPGDRWLGPSPRTSVSSRFDGRTGGEQWQGSVDQQSISRAWQIRFARDVCA